MINGESVLFGVHSFDMYPAGSDMEYNVYETFVLEADKELAMNIYQESILESIKQEERLDAFINATKARRGIM
jgi:hypothetical protein